MVGRAMYFSLLLYEDDEHRYRDSDNKDSPGFGGRIHLRYTSYL
jgi:hypothetical protein